MYVCHAVFFSSLTRKKKTTSPGSFDLLVYTSHDLNVPMQWGESDARLVKNGTELAFRGFSTSIHRVSTTVSYRNPNA